MRHKAIPKPMVLVCNALELRPVQIDRLYRQRFHIEAAFHELRGKWNLNRFVGNRFSQVVGHVDLAVFALLLHRCFRVSLQQHTKQAGTRTLRAEVHEAKIAVNGYPEAVAQVLSQLSSESPEERAAAALDADPAVRVGAAAVVLALEGDRSGLDTLR